MKRRGRIRRRVRTIRQIEGGKEPQREEVSLEQRANKGAVAPGRRLP